MKLVRFNDRMWFGKHKGVRLSDLINSDYSFVMKLINDKVIILDEKGNNQLKKIQEPNIYTPYRNTMPTREEGEFRIIFHISPQHFDYANTMINDSVRRLFSDLHNRIIESITNNIRKKIQPVLQAHHDNRIEIRRNRRLTSLRDIIVRVENDTVITFDAV